MKKNDKRIKIWSSYLTNVSLPDAVTMLWRTIITLLATASMKKVVEKPLYWRLQVLLDILVQFELNAEVPPPQGEDLVIQC